MNESRTDKERAVDTAYARYEEDARRIWSRFNTDLITVDEARFQMQIRYSEYVKEFEQLLETYQQKTE